MRMHYAHSNYNLQRTPCNAHHMYTQVLLEFMDLQVPIIGDLRGNLGKVLELVNHGIGDEGAIALAGALPHMTNLQDPWLNLSASDLGGCPLVCPQGCQMAAQTPFLHPRTHS